MNISFYLQISKHILCMYNNILFYPFNINFKCTCIYFCYFPENHNMIFLIIFNISGIIIYYSLPGAILFLKCSMKVTCMDFHIKVIEMFIDFLKHLILNWPGSLEKKNRCLGDSRGSKTFFSLCILWHLSKFCTICLYCLSNKK